MTNEQCTQKHLRDLEARAELARELVATARLFVEWVDDCWGATEILSPRASEEYNRVVKVLAKAEKLGVK